MEEIKWSEKVTNEQVLDRVGEKRTLINNILRRKANWIGHILQRLRGVRGQDNATETGRKATPQTIVVIVRNMTLN